MYYIQRQSFNLKMLILKCIQLPLISMCLNVKCPFLLVVLDSAPRIPLGEEKYTVSQASLLSEEWFEEIPDSFRQPWQRLQTEEGYTVLHLRSAQAPLGVFVPKKIHTNTLQNRQVNQRNQSTVDSSEKVNIQINKGHTGMRMPVCWVGRARRVETWKGAL